MSDAAPNLIEVVRKGDIDPVREAIAAGAKITETDKWGNSALMYAAASGNVGICEVLIDAGSVVDHKNQWGMEARDWSRWSDHQSEIINLLR